MNVSNYFTDRRVKPSIHESAYIDEFKNVHQFGVLGRQRLQIAEDIEGARPFQVSTGEKVFLDDFGHASSERLAGGEHPWSVFGSFGGPLDLDNENQFLYNPHGLDDKDVFLARWQQQAGTENDFSQRLENIETGVSLTDIKNENTDYEGELRKLKEALKEPFGKYPRVVETLHKQKRGDIDTRHAERKEMMKEDAAVRKERRPRSKVVVEPVVGRPTAAATPPPGSPVPITPVRKPAAVVGGGEEKKADESSDDDDEQRPIHTPTKGSKEYHNQLDSLEMISNLLSGQGELSEKEMKDARKLFADADIHLSKNVKTKFGLAKAYNKRVDILASRNLIKADEFPKLEEKRKRK